MKLHYSPGACSIGIHIILEEIGAPFETQLTSVRDGSNTKPDYVALNPKAKVPALVRDDGSVLTEWPAIAWWLARTHPDAKLLPTAPEAEARVMEAIDYIVATVHMQGFTRIARPGNFAPEEALHEAVKARGREIYAKGLELLERSLGGRDWLAGDYSIADAALFFIENWSGRAEVPLPPGLAAHFARMKARPAVQRAAAREGVTL